MNHTDRRNPCDPYQDCMALIAIAGFAYTKAFKGKMGKAEWYAWDGAWCCAEQARLISIAYA